jgi:hypothetical protein
VEDKGENDCCRDSNKVIGSKVDESTSLLPAATPNNTYRSIVSDIMMHMMLQTYIMLVSNNKDFFFFQLFMSNSKIYETPCCQ